MELGDSTAVRDAEAQRDEDSRILLSLMRQRQQMMREIAERDRWMRIVMDEYDRETAPMKVALGNVEEQIKATAERLIPDGKKSVDVPGHGRVQFRDYAESVRIGNPDAMLEWAREVERDDLYETVQTYKLDRTAAVALAKQALASAGEVLPGVEVRPARREAYIEDGGIG